MANLEVKQLVPALGPEILELAASEGRISDEWHTDLTFLQSPSVMFVLRIVKGPSLGGDTMWANACAAYEALSPALRELCDGLTALHDAQAHGKPELIARHPVVRVHPETGRPSLQQRRRLDIYWENRQ